ncbi:hypothetical protein [Flavobacterium sandaracinum]|uniref:Uncharacterized protein n=1 Tax=Flavobacterium sandaracinum TaxID=2541733 RepID=A0A4R5CQX6_9FLAO|nr:hypothetical protein [Flavobacterium sandaracinum]TDE00834.1 hypothetical protein E0F91_15595 [Flavobacterium sandaracinum]
MDGILQLGLKSKSIINEEQRKLELDVVHQKLTIADENGCRDELNKGAYDRWFQVYNIQILNLEAVI